MPLHRDKTQRIAHDLCGGGSRLDDPAKVLVVEDDPAVRRAFVDRVVRAGYSVVEADSVQSARNAYQSTPTDFRCAIVDYLLPDGSGADIVTELLRRDPVCRSVIITGAYDPEVVRDMGDAGVHQYLHKPRAIDEIAGAVRSTVASTEKWRDALKPPGAATGEPCPVDIDPGAMVARLKFLGGLSPVKVIVAWRVLWGDSNKRIADLLNVTERTVKFHITDMLERLGADSRTGLLRVLIEDSAQCDPWAE